jgi:hypothetical protein
MHNLKPLVTSTIDDFDTIRNSKRNSIRVILDGFRPELLDRYNTFDVEFVNNSLENIPSVDFSDEISNSLLHCYNSKTKSKSALIKRVKENQLEHIRVTCQYCSLGSSSSIDHYIPKEQYPDFSINHRNLIPCCFDCNLFKGENWFDPVLNTRTILNLYTDSLPEVQFLFVNITFHGNVPFAVFTINNINGISVEQFQIIENHYRILKLLNRYRELFNSSYKQVLSAFSSNQYLGNRDLVQISLHDDANSLFYDYGKNYYLAVIKKALSNNVDFLDQFN